MIFSDLFVRFYNEAFKYIDAQGPGELEKYHAAIARNVESRMLDNLKKGGLQALRDHYKVIKREENCELDVELIPGGLHFKMNGCPSLGKVLNNDAAPSLRYCEHCVNWTMPIYAKANLFLIYAMGDRDKPQCSSWVFDELEAARKVRSELLAQNRKITFNFD